MSQREVISLIKQYIKNLNSAGIPIHRAFLYGSYAKGEATKDSDIDVMLISDVFDNNDIDLKAMAWTFAWTLTKGTDTRIEPYTVGTKRFLTDDVSPILEIVRQEGVEIE